MNIINLNNFTNESLLKEIQKTLSNSKQEVLNRITILSQNKDIITAGVIEEIKVTPKVEKVTFFDYFVKIGNRLFQIQIKEEGQVASVYGIQYKTNIKKSEFIVRDNKVYYIKTDAFGTKYLTE